MIALLAASAMFLTGLQATISAPTTAFRGCLKTAGEKAKNEKVGNDAVEAYVRNACTVQGDALKTAVIAFRVKNGMTKKAAADDASMTIDDYVGTIVDNYQFMADYNKPKPAPAAPPVATPASQPTPPKP